MSNQLNDNRSSILVFLMLLRISATTNTSPSIKAAAHLVKNHMDNWGNDQCVVLYHDLMGSELAFLMGTLRVVSYLEVKGYLQNPGQVPRLPGPCATIIGRNLAERMTKGLRQLVPQAHYMLLDQAIVGYENSTMKMESSEYPKTYISISLENPDSARSATINCLGEVFRNLWTEERGFVTPHVTDQPLRSCFDGKKVKVSAFGLSPYLVMGERSDDFRGVDASVMRILASKIGFDPIFTRANGWGTVVNGTWTGMVGSVQDGLTHMGLGNMAISRARMKVVDYTHYTYLYSVVLFCRKPDPDQPFLKIFLPMTWSSWASFGLSPILIALCSMVVIHKHPCFQANFKLLSTSFSKIASGLFLMLFQPFSLGHKCWINVVKDSTSGALGLGVWFLAAAFFNYFYSSTLRACLLTVSYTQPMNTVEDGIKNDALIYLISGSSVIATMSTSPNPYFRQAWDLAVENDRFYRGGSHLPEELIDGVLNDNYAVLTLDGIVHQFSNDFFIKHGYQPFHMMTETVFDISSAFCIAKDQYLLKTRIDPILGRLIESGIIEKLFSEYRPPKFAKERTDIVMDLWHFSSTFFFYAIFIAFSTGTFCLEYFQEKPKSLSTSTIYLRTIHVRSDFF